MFEKIKTKFKNLRDNVRGISKKCTHAYDKGSAYGYDERRRRDIERKKLPTKVERASWSIGRVTGQGEYLIIDVTEKIDKVSKKIQNKFAKE